MAPAIIAAIQVAVRYIIIAAVQLGIWSLIEKYAIPAINSAIQGIMTSLGVPEEKAKDIMANEVLQFAESIGIFAATLKTKMPLKVAELLGFTTKGWSKRVITGAAVKAGSALEKAGFIFGGSTKVATQAEAGTIISGAVKTLTGFRPAYDLLLKTLGVTFVGSLAISNIIDFGNWNSGAYQKTMQKIIGFITGGALVPDEDYRTSKTLSPEVFDKVYNTFKLEGAIGINDPNKSAYVAFTRDNLLDLLDIVGAELLRLEGSASTKDVIKASLPFIVFETQKEAPIVRQEIVEQKSVPQVKVFTGIVTQGTLGAPQNFVARENDMIDDINELQRSAENNLAAFLTSLAGRIVYEIKVQNSVTLKNGFVIRGTTQRIVSGYTSTGSARYKTVTNKFAILNIYVLTAKGSRTKIDSINLGPVNATTFTPTGEQLQLAEQNIQSNIITTDLAEVKEIIAPEQIIVQTPAAPQPQPTFAPPIPTTPRVSSGQGKFIVSQDGTFYRFDTQADQEAFLQSRGYTGTRIGGSGADEVIASGRAAPGPIVAPAAPVVAPPVAPTPTGDPLLALGLPPSNNPRKCFVATISEFFDVNRVKYPLLAERAKLYEAWGLGLAAHYVGTAEQNNRWLAEVKRRVGC